MIINPIKITFRCYAARELYHSSSKSNVESILKNGFDMRKCGYGNKSKGIYLSNHSRYAAFWAESGSPVIICHILIDQSHIKRYKSEIYSPLYDASEYVINKSEIIFPRYVINFDINVINFDFQNEIIGYTKLGYFGCSQCDKKLIRCDCQQFPTILDEDLLNNI